EQLGRAMGHRCASPTASAPDPARGNSPGAAGAHREGGGYNGSARDQTRRQVMAASESEVMAFVQKALGDLGGALTASMVVIGDKLGLYRALAAAGSATPGELAKRTNTDERCVREWCQAQAASGYLAYDAAGGRYTLPEAHAVALTDENSPACVLGGFQGMTAAMRAAAKVTAAFRTGSGVGWHENDPEL